MRHLGNWIVTIGATLFVFVLFISAYWEPDIRWLHFFQSWMYISAVALVWKGNKWGYFAGVGTALFWNYVTLFVNTFLKNGLAQASILLHTGRLPGPDQFISVPAWTGNLIIVAGSILAYSSFPEKRWTDLLRLIAATAGMTGFFAVIVALFQPRYLPLFRGALHPHLQM